MSESPKSDRLSGRVLVVTGAGRGIGAAYAKQAAAAGAMVVVNDAGGGLHGEDSGEQARTPAQAVVDEIISAGGRAVADHSDISDFDGAGELIDRAVDEFGGLDVLINNAGILRDRMLVSMSPEEFDDVVRVHLRGHFCTSQRAASYWRSRVKESGVRDAVLIQTTSIAGLHGNVGQFNYSAAKAGIASMAINGHLELNARLGVRSYGIAPSARTRLTLSAPGAVDAVEAPKDGGFDFFAPEYVAPFVLWLAAEGCPAPSGQVFGVEGDLVRRYEPWSIAATVTNGGKGWTFDTLDEVSDEFLGGEQVISAGDIIELTARHVADLRSGVAS